MKINNKSKTLLSKALKLLYYIVITFVCLVIIALLFYVISSHLHSNKENYKTKFSLYTIVSPSMTPVINVYDVVLNIGVEKPEDIQVGDIITYVSTAPASEGMTITHRVVEVEKMSDGTYEYLTQGDNNSTPDSVSVTFDKVIGKELLIIPYLGKLQFLIASKKSLLIIIVIPIFIYLLKDIKKLIELIKLKYKVSEITSNNDDELENQKQLETQRKKELTEKLERMQAAKEALIKSQHEPSTFLEKYTETVVEVSKKKKVKKDIKEVKTTNERIEILDTDELTSKIKEYDQKLQELEIMLEKIRNERDQKKNISYEDVIKEEDFLKGKKIKVVNVELTKNQKIVVKHLPITDNEEYTINHVSKIEENTSLKEPEKNTRLNLNPTKIKQVKRKSKKKQKNKNKRIITIEKIK